MQEFELDCKVTFEFSIPVTATNEEAAAQKVKAAMDTDAGLRWVVKNYNPDIDIHSPDGQEL